MASFNQVILMGNLTKDVTLKYLPNQTAVAEFGIAVNRKYKTADGQEREEVTFVDCASFGKQGEVINQYFTKGKPIFIVGRLKFDSWEDKQGGKRSKLSVIVDQFQFVGGRDGANQDDADMDQRPQPQRRPASDKGPAAGSVRQPTRPVPTNPIGDDTFEDSDIPFDRAR